MARQADPRVRTQIAKNLRRIIGEREIGQLAKAIGMPQAQLSGYAGAHRGFSIETLLRLAVKFGCSLDQLVYGVDLEYTRASTKRKYPDLEDDGELMDVLAGFDLIRRDNPAEAASLAAVFKARLLGALLPGDAAQHAAASSDATETSAPSAKRARPPRRGARS